jgi:signal transduction histidine kinase
MSTSGRDSEQPPPFAHVPHVTPAIHDFRHPRRRRRLATICAVNTGKWLDTAAYGTWLIGGLIPAIDIARGRLAGWAAVGFIAAFAVFGAGLVLFLECAPAVSRRGRRAWIAVIAVQSIAGLAMMHLSSSGTAGAALIVVAAAAAYVLPPRLALRVIAVNTMLIGLSIAARASWPDALSAAVAYGGFQLFALATSVLALSERAGREALARTNAELMAARSLLEENSRVSERVRIARDLHDTLGHHLTALSLQLDVASRLTSGAAAGHVQEAHAIAKLLLGDVRSVVSEMRDSQLDLANAVRALANAAGPLQVHFDMPASVDLDDAARAHALLRCVQEIITNASRHAAARNLWIRLANTRDGIALHARDDGRGTALLTWGNGLKGMRERFEEYAGRVEFTSSEGHGFEVHGFMPRVETAP